MFLVQRHRGRRLSDGARVYYPDDDDVGSGVLTYEKTESKAIRAYARRVLGGESAIREDDEYVLYPIDEDAVIQRRVMNRRVQFRLAEVE